MRLEELMPEEIKSRIIKMNKGEAQAFLESLPPETQKKYFDYIMQGARDVLSYPAESPRD
jgi:hypothetical protein